jgi:hypothetical protein
LLLKRHLRQELMAKKDDKKVEKKSLIWYNNINYLYICAGGANFEEV